MTVALHELVTSAGMKYPSGIHIATCCERGDQHPTKWKSRQRTWILMYEAFFVY